jgi:hypothetical protein
MSTISISFSALFQILLLYKMRKLKPGRRVRITEDVPVCELVTSRLKACCLDGGKSLTAVSVTPILEK